MTAEKCRLRTGIAHWTDELISLDACPEAVRWAQGYASLAEAWSACSRGDWMLWFAGRLAGQPWSESRKPMVLAACACARLALPYVPLGEERPRQALEAAEAWATGRVTEDELRTAVAYAYVAYTAADAAAYAAAYAAAAAYADVADAEVAYAATYAAAAAAYADVAAADVEAGANTTTRRAVLSQCADLVRGFYPTPPKGGAT